MKKYQNNIDSDTNTSIYLPLYHGDSVIGNAIFNHLFALLSFFIPIFIYLFMLNLHSLPPFGPYSLLHTDSIIDAAGTLHSLLHSISQKQFSLLSPVFNGFDNGQSLLFYMLDPLKLLLFFFSAEKAISFLPVIWAIQIGFSGLALYLYLTRRPLRSYSPYDPKVLLFSLSYSLSAFMIVQSMQYEYMWAASLFPLLFLFYQRNQCDSKNYKPLLFTLTFLLLSQFYIELCVILILIVHNLIFDSGSIHDRLLHFFTFLKVILGSMLLSAFTIIPGIMALNFKLPEMKSIMDPLEPLLGLFSRFFLGSAASYYNTFHSGTNLFCGTLIFLLSLAGIVFLSSDKKTRIQKILFAFILFFILSNKALYSLFTLCRSDDPVFHPLCFIIIFFVILSATDAIEHFRALSAPLLIASIFLPGILFLLSLRFTSYISDTMSMLISLSIIVLYDLLLYFYWTGSIRKRPFILIVLMLTLFELYFETNYILLDAKNDNLILNDQISDTVQTQNYDAYYPFAGIINQDDQKTEDILSFSIPSIFISSAFAAGEANPSTTEDTGSSIFDKLNERALLLGATEPLFTTFTPHFDINTNSDNLQAIDSNDGTVTLQQKTIDEHADYFIEFKLREHPGGSLFLELDDLYSKGILDRDEKTREILYLNSDSFIDGSLQLTYSAAILNETVLNALTASFSKPIYNTSAQSLTSRSLEISAPMDGLLTLPYQTDLPIIIYLDGARIPLKKIYENLISVPITSGKHIVLIKRSITAEMIGLLVSLITFACLILLPLFSHKKQNRTKEA